MNNQFGGDENRKCNEESDMHFDIVKKESRPRLPSGEPKVERSKSGSHATRVTVSSRRGKSSKWSPSRCAFRTSWKSGPPSTNEKSCASSRKMSSVKFLSKLVSGSPCVFPMFNLLLWCSRRCFHNPKA